MKTHTIHLPLSEALAAELLCMQPEAAGRAFQAALVHYHAEALLGPPEALRGEENAIAEWLRMIDVSRARAAAGRAGASKFVENRFAPNKINFALSKQAEALHEAVRVQDEFDVLSGLDAFM